MRVMTAIAGTAIGATVLRSGDGKHDDQGQEKQDKFAD